MMAKLTVEKWGSPIGGKQTMRISGFADGELNELKSMDHHDATEKLLDMLDHRNQGLGTQWMCGYGVWGVWYDDEFAYANISTSCD